MCLICEMALNNHTSCNNSDRVLKYSERQRKGRTTKTRSSRMCVKAPFEQQKLSEPVHRNVVNANLLQHEVRGEGGMGHKRSKRSSRTCVPKRIPKICSKKKHARKHNELECRLNIMHIPKQRKNRKSPTAWHRARRSSLRRDNHPDGGYRRMRAKRRAVPGKVQMKTRGDGALSTRQWCLNEGKPSKSPSARTT